MNDLLSECNEVFLLFLEYEVPDQEVDQNGPEERLWKKTVKHVN